MRVLGAIQVAADGDFVTAGPAKQSCVLAVLAFSPGQPLPIESLIDRVWGQSAPRSTRDALYQYLSQIRALGLAVHRTGAGYLLDLPAEQIDLYQARALAGQAQAAAREGDPAVAAGRYRQALSLWHGTPLAGISGEWATSTRETLERERLTLLSACFDAELAQGRHAEVLVELSAEVAARPLAERLAGQLMLALFRCGRAAEALDCYTQIRRRLGDELGVEPTPALDALQQQILRQDPALLADPAARRDAPRAGYRPPRQLPADIAAFAGRHAELATLDTIGGGDTSQAVVISAVSGTAGVGKTALAVHWAHRVADRFPDGQLYVNLRGFDPAGTALSPDEAVRGFLDAYAVPPQQVPVSLAAQAALFRSLLAGKRVLILLDNARDAEQVRPLLPGSPGCLALVTSRNQLTGLVAGEGARALRLDMLTEAESLALLAGRLGRERVVAEPDAVADLIERCARLPLALAVVAARVAVNPDLSLASLARELREARVGLDALGSDDPATDVRAAFHASYRVLSPAAQRLFRLIALHPGPEVSITAAAGLAGVAAGAARAGLTELARAHLLTEPSAGRFTCHDLLRAYAGELVAERDAEPDRDEAVRRLLDYYLHSADAAAQALDPHRDGAGVTGAPPGIEAERFADRQSALAWLAVEHPVLVAAVDLAVARGLDDYTCRLAAAIAVFLDWQGYSPELADTQGSALAAAERLGDRTRQARAHRDLAQAYVRLNRREDALAHLRRAHDLFEGDPAGQASVLMKLGWLREQQAAHDEARRYAESALELYRLAGHLAGQAHAWGAIGWSYAAAGDYQQALIQCREALALNQKINNRYGEASAWDSIGFVHHHLGQYREAVACYRSGLKLVRDLGDRPGESILLDHLGDTHRAAGDLPAARHAWGSVLEILVPADSAAAARIRAKFDEALALSLGA
ncbi:BTAD domain-containing putative transcriptional regulator [Amorphoplanes digitatis]|uniref:DNA-binding SARP family transcriptional activator n=1 Tax=Actinoplanes digitatis TaxID=1868 RepID=A0A7W7MST3_9ACTN|nr:BTAD domain-containing putative transcriptional regulator [Actinoplanes digitatis]MBB4764884.1 DNA-binding SARP family transcriptional activator [Actinoplanes digitatis]